MKGQIEQIPTRKRPAQLYETVYMTNADGLLEPIEEDDDLIEEDDAFYGLKKPSSARRYYAPPTAVETRNHVHTIMRVTKHHTAPPIKPRASLKAQQPQQQAQQKPVKQAKKGMHWLFYVGTGMVGMFALWTAGTGVFSWLQAQHDNSVYGTPRTYQCDAVVDNSGEAHFIAENLNGHIIVIEVRENNLASTKVYSGPVFSGAGADDDIATLSFKDVNGDGKPDMIITADNQLFVYINTGNGFRPSTPSDHINQLEVN